MLTIIEKLKDLPLLKIHYNFFLTSPCLVLSCFIFFLAGKTGASVISAVQDLKLVKQEETRDAQPKQTGEQAGEDSESSDTDSSDSDDKSLVASAKEPTTEAGSVPQAPVELKGEVSVILSFCNTSLTIDFSWLDRSPCFRWRYM